MDQKDQLDRLYFQKIRLYIANNEEKLKKFSIDRQNLTAQTLQQSLGSLNSEQAAEILIVCCYYLQGVDKELDSILRKFGSSIYNRVLLPSYADTLLYDELPSEQNEQTDSG